MFASLNNGLIEAPPRSGSGDVKICAHQLKDWPQIAPLWDVMAENSPYSSFYLSEDWTSIWLEVFGESLNPRILVFEVDAVPVGVCLLVEDAVRRGPFRVSRVYLNTGAGTSGERPFMEFNSLLCIAGWEEKIATALGDYLRELEWDEFAIEGICPSPMLSWLHVNTLPDLGATVKVRSSCYVDLDRLRACKRRYESSLSSNTREQLRRSVRRYEKIGPVNVEPARDLLQAQAFFEHMRRMHQARWIERGENGAFGGGCVLDFHRLLIRRGFPKGSIQMLRVSAGTQTIGILYNFVQHGKVYFFQSGFNYKLGKNCKPGIVTHALAIQHCLDAGFSDYDFLAGDARYKRSLSTDCRPLEWVVFSRPGMRLAVIELLRAMKRRMNGVEERLAN